MMHSTIHKPISLARITAVWGTWHVLLMLCLIISMAISLVVGFLINLGWVIIVGGSLIGGPVFAILAGILGLCAYIVSQFYAFKYLFGYQFLDFELDISIDRGLEKSISLLYEKLKAGKIRSVFFSYFWRYWIIIGPCGVLDWMKEESSGLTTILLAFVHCFASFWALLGSLRQDYKDFHIAILPPRKSSTRANTTIVSLAEENMDGHLIHLAHHFGCDVRTLADYRIIRDTNKGSHFNYVLNAALYEEAKRQQDIEAFSMFEQPEARSFWNRVFPSTFAASFDSQYRYGEKFIKEKIEQIIQDFQGSPFQWILDSRSTPKDLNFYLSESGFIWDRNEPILLVEDLSVNASASQEWEWKELSLKDLKENREIQVLLSESVASSRHFYQAFIKNEVFVEGDHKVLCILYRHQLVGICTVFFSAVLGVYTPLLTKGDNHPEIFLQTIKDFAHCHRMNTIILIPDNGFEYEGLKVQEVGTFTYYKYGIHHNTLL